MTVSLQPKYLVTVQNWSHVSAVFIGDDGDGAGSHGSEGTIASAASTKSGASGAAGAGGMNTSTGGGGAAIVRC